MSSTTPARAGASAVVAVVGAAGLLLVLVTWAASIGPDRVVSGGHVERIRPDEPSFSTQAADDKDSVQEVLDKKRGDPPGWLGVIAFALEIITVLVVLFLVGRVLRKLRLAWRARTRRRRRRRPKPEDVEFEVLGSPGRATEVMADDAEEQRSLLEVEGEPRNAIVECWHRFEQQAVRAGIDRRPWQTTSEFVLGLLDLVGADRGAVTQLAELYREARFSDHPMTDAHRRRALESLDAIHRSLRTRTVVR